MTAGDLMLRRSCHFKCSLIHYRNERPHPLVQPLNAIQHSFSYLDGRQFPPADPFRGTS